jgi:hypothetical protein
MFPRLHRISDALLEVAEAMLAPEPPAPCREAEECLDDGRPPRLPRGTTSRPTRGTASRRLHRARPPRRREEPRPR